MTTINKIVRLGTQPGLDSIFCRIKFNGRELSIIGVEGPTSDGNCRGACGQIDMHEWDLNSYAPGWDAAMVARFREVWHRWHLNCAVAGSPAQEAFLLANPVERGPDRYERTKAALAAAGLQPDPSYLHEGKPYSYGSAWLRVDVPEDVLAFLASLPDTDETPAWV